jgi:hypothetical protein
MSSDKYLKIRPGRSNYYYQRAVPRDLQRKFGKVISESLNTSDKREARKLRDVKSVYWSTQFDRERASREQRGPVAKSSAVLEQLKDMLTMFLDDNEWPDPVAAKVSPWVDLAESVSERGTAVPMDIQQKVYQLAMALSEYHNDPDNFDRDAAAELVKKSEPKRTMAELRDLYLKDKESQGIRQKSLNSQRSRLEVLEDNGWNVEQVRQILQQNERTDKTIENWLMTYTTFSNWLKSEHDKELPIPKFKYNKFSGTRDVFTVEELQGIFRHPMDETMRWVCLVSLHQGFRASETLQLNRADVRQHHEYWIFDIHDRGKEKHLKTRSTARKVPVHPWLVENGFLEYWEANEG